MTRQHRRRTGRIRFRIQVRQVAQAIFLDVFDGVRRAVDAMRIAQVVKMDCASIVRLPHVVGEDGVQPPLLQNQFRQAQVDGLGVVGNDVGILRRLHVHQTFDELPRDGVQGQILKLVAIATLNQDVVHQLADQFRANSLDIAGDDLVFDFFRNAACRLLVHIELVNQLMGDPATIPGHDIPAGHGFDQQQRLVSQVRRFIVAVISPHVDGLAGAFAHLAVALVRSNRRRQLVLSQRDLDHVLNIFKFRYPVPIAVRKRVVFAKRIVKLLNNIASYAIRSFL